MPCHKPRIVFVPKCHLLRKGSCSFSVFFAVYTIEITHSVSALQSVIIYRHNFRIFLAHPFRLCCSRSGKANVNFIFPENVQDLIQPFKIINAFFRLKLCPGKNGKSDIIDMAFLEVFHILADGSLIPLVRIVVSSEIEFFYFLSFHSCVSLIVCIFI